MISPRDIVGRLAEVRLAPRLGLALAAAAPVVALLPGALAWLVALAWLGALTLAVRRDIAATPTAASLAVTRTGPAKYSIGVPNRVVLHIRNSSAYPARITGRESPPPEFVGTRTFGPLEVAPHDSAEVELTFTPPRRGAYAFDRIGVRMLGPAGLAGRQLSIGPAEEIRVYPDITAVQRYSLLARRGALHEIGVRAMRFAGRGTEFESLRDYAPGDSYSDIDWKATARRGRPVVRQFEAERSQTIVLAIDAGRLMTAQVGGLSKLDRAVNAALLLAFLATRMGDSVGLLVFGRDVRKYLPPRKGHRQFLAVLEALYAVEERVEEPDYAGALRYLAARVGKRSLVVLFTELVGTDPSRRLLGVLSTLAPRHLPLVITQRNEEVERIASAPIGAESDAMRSAVAQDLLHDKIRAVRALRARGSLVLDVVPEELSVAAVNRFLEIKARGRL